RRRHVDDAVLRRRGSERPIRAPSVLCRADDGVASGGIWLTRWRGAELRRHLLGERAERVPVVRAVAEGDVDAGAAGVAEGGDHLPGLRRGAPQPARALAALGAPVLPKGLFCAQSPLGVRAQVEAEVDGPQDGLRVAPLL